MNRTRVLAATAVLALAFVPASASAGATDETTGGGTTTLTFDVQFSPFFMLDFGPTGVREVTSFQDPFDVSRGDQVIFRDQLLRRGEPIGHTNGACTVTEFVPTATDPIKLNCQMSIELPNGQVTAQGAATNNPVKPLAVTGGTGRYTGASGSLTLTEFGNGTGRLALQLTRR